MWLYAIRYQWYNNLFNSICFLNILASMFSRIVKRTKINKFRVCQSVHHHTFKWINQPDAAVSQVYCLSFLGLPARPRPTALLPPRYNGKPEAATAVVELLMMGVRMPETCWAIFKRQAINPRNCCIWLVDSFKKIKKSYLIDSVAITNKMQLGNRIY